MRIIELDIIELFEAVSRDELIGNIERKRNKAFREMILKKMHELVQRHGDRQSIGGYAYEISRYLGGSIAPKELEKMYRAEYINESQINEWGRIVKGVNTTVDIGPDEIKKQARKFGNTVDRDGFPPKMTTAVKPKSTTVKHHKSVRESEEPRYTAAEWAIIEGGHTLEETVTEPKKPGIIFEALIEGDLIDNKNGWGAVPNNQDVDYKGLRVKMTPKNFIELAAPLNQEPSEEIVQHITQGGSIGSPFLIIEIPESWEDGDFSMPAKVVGHEGRNRMLAIIKALGNNPIETHLFFSHGLRNRHITDEFKKNLNKGLVKQRSKSIARGPIFTESISEAFDTDADWIHAHDNGDIQVFATKVEDAYIELTYKRMSNDDVYIGFSRGGRSSVTGEGSQNKIFGAVINHIQKWVAKNAPVRIVFSAFKPNTGAFGAQNTTRSSLYRRMVQRFASQNGYEYDVEDTGNEDTFILTKQTVDENFADGKKKGKSRPGRVKRAGASCNGSVTDLRKRAKNASGEKAKMYHWCANMKSGRKKK